VLGDAGRPMRALAAAVAGDPFAAMKDLDRQRPARSNNMRGTEGLQTPRWREPDSNRRSRLDGRGLRDRLYHLRFLSPLRFRESGSFCCRSGLGAVPSFWTRQAARNPAGVILMSGSGRCFP
jgi:hypothetical protein